MSNNSSSSAQSKKAVGVDPTLHRAMKIAAALRSTPMRDVVDEAFRYWLVVHGDENLRRRLPEQFRHAEVLKLQPRSSDFLDC
jgi:hypothetical protein